MDERDDERRDLAAERRREDDPERDLVEERSPAAPPDTDRPGAAATMERGAGVDDRTDVDDRELDESDVDDPERHEPEAELEEPEVDEPRSGDRARPAPADGGPAVARTGDAVVEPGTPVAAGPGLTADEARAEELEEDRELGEDRARAERAELAAEKSEGAVPHPEGQPFDPLDGEQTGVWRQRWETLQASFVDDPKSATEQADSLVGEVLDHLRQRYDELRGDLRSQADRSDTEAMRVTLQRYRGLFRSLVS